jgi:hypothetical protein
MPEPLAIVCRGTCGCCHEPARLVGHGAVCGTCLAEMTQERLPSGFRAEWTGVHFTLSRPRRDPMPWSREWVWCGNYDDVDLLVRDARFLAGEGGPDGR